MSFKPFHFEFNPPDTIPAPLRSDTEAFDPDNLSLSDKDRATNAGQLIDQLSEMMAASQYLQTALVERFRNTGVEVNLAANPEIASALGRIYGTDNPPSIVTIPMLDNLLNAEAGIVLLESLLDADSEIEPNSVQYADIMLVTQQIEHLLIESGEFRNQLPMLLRQLKGDNMIFQQWIQGLQKYPVLLRSSSPTQTIRDTLNTPGPLGNDLIQVRNLDVSNPVFNFTQDWMNRYSSIYSSIYKMMATVNHVEQGIAHVVNAFVLQPVQDIVRIIGLFNSLKGIFHKGSLTKISDALAGFVFARIGGQIGGFMFLLDRFVRMAVDPIKNAIGQIGGLLGTINRAATAVGQATGALKGLSADNHCSGSPHASATGTNKLVNITALGGADALPEALKTLGDHINWATRTADRERNSVNESFRKLAERRGKDASDRLDVMCSLQSLDSLIAIAQGFVNETQRGTSFATASQPQKLEAYNRILTSLKTGSDTKFEIQDGEVVITPPDMPEPNEKVQNVLRRGGLNRIVKEDLLRVKGVLP
jgi:hypothetical protein